MRCRRALPAILALCFASTTALAGGPAAKGDPRVAARALAERGHELYEAGKYAEAIDVLQQAEKLFHAPTLVLALARAHVGAGKLLEARALLQGLVAEKLGPSSPRAFVEARRSGLEELTALEARIPTVTIRVRGAGSAFRVSLDGAELADWHPSRAVAQNPGAHEVAVSTAGKPAVTRSFDLAPGARLGVDIDLAAPPPGAPGGDATSAPRPWLAPAIAALGVGAVGLGVGIGTGVLTLKAASDLRSRCGDTCPPTDANKGDVSAANTMGVASTVGFALAGAGLLTGVVLLAVKPGAKAEAGLRTDVGPGSIRVSGVF